MIKAIFFDVDNTLLDFAGCVKYSMRSGLEARGVEFEESMLKTFKEINDELWERVEKGTLSREGLSEIRWNLVFEKLGIDLDGVEFEEYFKDCLNESAIEVEGAMELLRYLQPKYRLYVASNGPYERQKRRLEKAGMYDYFEKIFVSGAVGFFKPNPEFFEVCFKSIGDIHPSESVIIGDSITADICGGINAGMGTCWLNVNGAQPPKDIKPDYIIKNLREAKKFF